VTSRCRTRKCGMSRCAVSKCRTSEFDSRHPMSSLFLRPNLRLTM
jgi:hypothetical protein